jgi:hypothetical protein
MPGFYGQTCQVLNSAGRSVSCQSELHPRDSHSFRNMCNLWRTCEWVDLASHVEPRLQICPGGGLPTDPTLSSICSIRGQCQDGRVVSPALGTGTGICDCNDYFYGPSCGAGVCPPGMEPLINPATLLVECEDCGKGDSQP